MKRRARRHACALCAGRKLTHIELRHVGLVCLLYEGKLEEMPQGRQAVRWCALIGEHCRGLGVCVGQRRSAAEDCDLVR
jgi:hypothetical protein